MLVNGKNVSKFIGEDLSSIQKIITESLKHNRSLEVQAVAVLRSSYVATSASATIPHPVYS
jgi:hypothetical protein